MCGGVIAGDKRGITFRRWYFIEGNESKNFASPQIYQA